MVPTDPGSLAIVVTNIGAADLLARHLVALSRGLPEAHVVVVDDHSSAGEAAQVERLCLDHGWRALLLPTDQGFGPAVNRGVAAAREHPEVRHLLLLQPDVVLSPAAATHLHARVEADPLVLVAPLLTRPSGSLWSAGTDLLTATGEMRSWHRRADDTQAFRPWLDGACLALSLELWDRVEGFDEDYFLTWDDVDLSHRVVEQGGHLVVDGDVAGIHLDGPTFRAPGSIAYLAARNRLLYAAKHLSRSQQRRWSRTSRRAARRAARQTAHQRRHRWQTRRGTRAGRRLMKRVRRQEAGQSSGSAGGA